MLFNTSWSEEEFKCALRDTDIKCLMFGTGYSRSDYREICDRLKLDEYPMLERLIYIGTMEEKRYTTLDTLPESSKSWEEPDRRM